MSKFGLIGTMPFVAMSFLVLISTGAVAEEMSFPNGTATPSETCGECHNAIYREYVLGVGSDSHIAYATSQAPACVKLPMPANVSSFATAHASSGSHTRDVDSDRKSSCNICHFPNSFTISNGDTAGKMKPKTGMSAQGGLTCAGCHLTPEGNVRSVHINGNAPHKTVAESALQTSALCAHCHGGGYTGIRVVGKQFQTFREWQEDFFKPGLGTQQCQDCHMPRTLRKVSEDFDGAPCAVARHLWTGANSRQRHLNSLSLTIIQPEAEKHKLSFSVTNIGAGHSVPTGAGARAVFLLVDIMDKKGISLARKEWMFAPSHGDRPDDKALLEDDKKLSGWEATAQARADAQGPHEPSIRAGEERVLAWEPSLAPGMYTVNAKLVYTLDRFNNKPINGEQSEIGSAMLVISTK